MTELTPLAAELFRQAQQALHFTADEMAIMRTAYDRQMVITQQREAQQAGAPVPEPQYGPPIDWAHDGSERHADHSPGYRCPRCRDAGAGRRHVPLGHPDFGRPVPCACQTEDPALQHQRFLQRRARSGLPPQLLPKTLDTFRAVAGTQDARQAARAFLEDLRREPVPRWLVFYGGTGRGKTHLLAALTQAALLQTDVLWAEVPEFLEACKATAEVDGARVPFAADTRLTQAAITATVLVLDEFGAAGEGPWAREKLELILNQRLEAGRPTLCGMTITCDELAAWSPRIASRFSDGTRVREVQFTGRDYRERAAAS